MDVCTLIVRTIITLQACVGPETCTEYPDANLKICIPAGPISCPMPEQQYVCRRPDGTEYIRNRSDLNLPKG